MVLFVGKCLRGANYNRVARVNTHRVNVFHIADGNGGVVTIAHYLVFDFLITLYAFFHQNLMNG